MGLDTVETVLWAEAEFGIAIADADAAEVRTVGEFAALIHRQLVVRDGLRALTEAQVFERTKRFLVAYFALAPAAVTRHAEFVKDLGLD